MVSRLCLHKTALARIVATVVLMGEPVLRQASLLPHTRYVSIVAFVLTLNLKPPFQGFAASSSSFLAPTLGFASNLSHTIIRETQEDDDRSVHSNDSESTNVSITDEELALLGAPWAKEGMLCRKHFFEAENKRAKTKNWLDVFVVIQKGELSMFTFGESGGAGTTAVGGGNWLVGCSITP